MDVSIWKDGQRAGHLILEETPEGWKTETISVLPKYQHNGIARLLIQVGTELNNGQIPPPGFIAPTRKARAFWKSLGFEE
jgi:GNAT superfamily N-acetyltransferase